MARDLIKISKDKISESHPSAQNIRVVRFIEVGGLLNATKLAYLTYEDTDADNQKQTISCLLYDDQIRGPQLFNNPDEFIKWYSMQRSGPGFWAQVVDWSGGVAGIIAVAIVAVLLYEYTRTAPADFKPPELLSHAFSVVLGYYFGSKVTSKATRS